MPTLITSIGFVIKIFPDMEVICLHDDALKPICKRTLRRQVLEYINRIALVEEFYATKDEQKLYDLVTDYLQQ
jgi:hypothetical protein